LKSAQKEVKSTNHL